MNSVGLQRVTIGALDPDITNALIVGIIIGKQDPKSFKSKKPNEPDRGVLNFTLRDSPTDYINVTCWGGLELISTLNEKFWVGDVVNFMKPRITIRNINDIGEQFRPAVTSPFSLTYNEGISDLMVHDGNEYRNFMELSRYPTKPIQGFMSLTEIMKNGEKLNGCTVDLLVAIQNIKPSRVVKTANGDKRMREIVVFDRTAIGVNIAIWNADILLRADKWESKNTILFIADIKVTYIDFYKCFAPVIGPRTIFTENPAIQEAMSLREYAKNMSFKTYDILEQALTFLPHPSTINTVMSVLQLKNKMQAALYSHNEERLTALIYAVVTKLDLDSFSTPMVANMCDSCNVRIDKNLGSCVNKECPVGQGSLSGSSKPAFHIPVELSDHTGTLKKCYISGQQAENILQCSVIEFMAMSDEEKVALKWKFLLERCSVRLFILKVQNRKSIVTTVLSMERANIAEVAGNMTYY